MRRHALAALALLAGSSLALAQESATPPPPRQPGQGQPGRPPREGQPGEGQPGQPGQGRRGGGQGQPQNLEGAMKSLNRNARQLRETIGDPSKNADSLRALNAMQNAAVFAKGQALPDDVPAMETAKDDAARKQIQDTYRRNLLKLTRTMLDMEQDILDGKNDAAKAKLPDLIKLRDDSHKFLGIKEDEGGDRPPGGGGEGRGRGEGNGEGRGRGRPENAPPPSGGKPEDIHPAPGHT